MYGHSISQRSDLAISTEPLRGSEGISVRELADMRSAGKKHTVLDVREARELDVCRLEGALHIPMAEISVQTDNLPTPGPVIYGSNFKQARSAVSSRSLVVARRSRQDRSRGTARSSQSVDDTPRGMLTDRFNVSNNHCQPANGPCLSTAAQTSRDYSKARRDRHRRSKPGRSITKAENVRRN
jgi:rhodanese-related sulfurtransferase